MRVIVVAAVLVAAAGATSAEPDAGSAPAQQHGEPTGTGQQRRRRRKDGSELKNQLHERGIPYDGLSVVQMQEALDAANRKADQDSQSCPDNGAFDKAEQHEYCVIGAGPGGLQMAALLHSAQRDYVVIERAAVPGSFYQRYPRHRNLISINKRYTGRNNAEFNWRHDWNSLLSPSSGPASNAPRFWEFSDDYFPAADAWVEYAHSYSQGLNIRYSTEVTKVSRKRKSLGADFVLHTESARSETISHTRCQTLIVATSLPKPYIPPIDGLEEVSIGYEDDDFSINPEDFRNKTVLILGKKQSAMETAKNICERWHFEMRCVRSVCTVAHVSLCSSCKWSHRRAPLGQP